MLFNAYGMHAMVCATSLDCWLVAKAVPPTVAAPSFRAHGLHVRRESGMHACCLLLVSPAGAGLAVCLGLCITSDRCSYLQRATAHERLPPPA